MQKMCDCVVKDQTAKIQTLWFIFLLADDSHPTPDFATLRIDYVCNQGTFALIAPELS